MQPMNAKYTDIKHCTIVLNAVNLCTMTVFYASVQNKFPTDITKLTLQLTRVCNQNKEHHRLLNGLASRIGLKANDDSETRVTMNTVTETIPRKAKSNVKYGVGYPAAASSFTLDGDAEGAKCGDCALLLQELVDKPSKCLENTSHEGL